MLTLLILLLILFSSIPPLTLFFCLKWIYKDHWKYGWHLFYFFKYIFSLSFLPLLFITNLNLGLKPVNNWSLVFLITTILLALLGIKPAIKQKVLQLYLGGVYASFMEEILYRSIIFGLVLVIWKNQWIALVISSFLFGCWHLKNYCWVEKPSIYTQFFYTSLFYGPVFALMRIYTGDIYLAIFFHYLTDATVALAPDWMRKIGLVRGGRGGKYMDDFNL